MMDKDQILAILKMYSHLAKTSWLSYWDAVANEILNAQEEESDWSGSYILPELVAECMRQDAKWGAVRELRDETWLSILIEEIGEVAMALNKEQPYTEGRKELIQIGAVVLNWIFSADCHKRSAPPEEGEQCEQTIRPASLHRPYQCTRKATTYVKVRTHDRWVEGCYCGQHAKKNRLAERRANMKEQQLAVEMTDKKRPVRLTVDPPVEKKHELKKGMEITLQYGEVKIQPQDGKDPYWVEGWWYLGPAEEWVKLLPHEYELADMDELEE